MTKQAVELENNFSAELINGGSILLFDGVCNLCNASVQFILKRDSKGLFRFASLQSPTGQALLRFAGLPTGEISTVVLFENGKPYLRSDAGLRIARQLPGLWPVLYGLIVIPRPLRNWVYNWIARNRYRWFGKQESCLMPAPEWKARFIDV
ncbi:MAG: thiol-disulfide oxidoreductase DCC family protein [Saprospiraceae bacterium]|nr:thiol-disulfide oxidoreductase DCC family protein [Saprospiraceae bacterium]MDZ4706479.1 thiol-disulfide oxidoreductase DCC family protein [Saprospiraceae bacterium]